MLADDPLLQMDFELMATSGEDGLPESADGDLSAKVYDLNKQVELYKEALTQAHLDLENMR